LPTPGVDTDAELALQKLLIETATKADSSIRAFEFQTGIVAVKEFIDAVNLYVTEQQPWVIAKGEDSESQERLATILYTICESLRAIAVLYSPIMPKAMETLWVEIGAAESGASRNFAGVATWGQLNAGVAITKGESLFPRIEEPASI